MKIWQRNALINFGLYSVDVAIAIAGMSFGFGIAVENWWALLGLMLISRWVFNTVHNAMLFADAERRARMGEPDAR